MGKIFLRSIFVFVVAVSLASAGEIEVRGHVVDEKGVGVAGADVSHFWSANGSQKDDDGNPLNRETEDNLKKYWAHEGEMHPIVPESVKTGADGRFSIKMRDIHYALLAMDAARSRGGLVVLAKGQESSPIEIRLGPLMRVRGSFDGPGPGVRPDWTHVYLNLPDNPSRPLDNTRLVGCGSFEAKFLMSLPPGRYSLEANDNDLTGELIPCKELVLTADVPEIDLGVLKLSPPKPSIGSWMRKQQAEGKVKDLASLYGKRLPPWHIVDARGIEKTAQLADFKGKWVLIDFWATNCSICLKADMPKLVRFYEEHQAERDRFEILAICVDVSEELKSVADVQRELEPIVKHVWSGKTLPFPILLDPSTTTLERWGVPGYDLLLIDPEGKVVEGDETTLAEKLK